MAMLDPTSELEAGCGVDYPTFAALQMPAGAAFQHILRLQNTNVDGRRNVLYALTAIRGVGRRFAGFVVHAAAIDPRKRAGELGGAEIARVAKAMAAPRSHRAPSWLLNRRHDRVSGRTGQLLGTSLDAKLRDDLERLKKIRSHRGLRHYWGLRVRGQHTGTTGRKGRTVGVTKRKGG